MGTSLTPSQGGRWQSVRVALVADLFASGSTMFQGGAERHLLHLALAMTEAGIECCIFQPGGRGATYAVGGVEVRTRPVGRHRLWSRLAHRAIAEGWTHLYFKYLEHVPAGLPRDRVSATQHGVYWDIPYETHGRPWYPGGAAARGYLPAWRAWQIAKSFSGLHRCSAVSAMDTSFLRVTQALWPASRGRIFVTAPFCDISRPAPEALAAARLPGDLEAVIAATHAAAGSVVLVPRNLSLVRGESWLPQIFTMVARKHAVVFIVTGQFLGHLDNTWRSARLVAADAAARRLPGGKASSLSRLRSCPRDTMAALYAAADIVLIPTFAHEGASLAAAEAMAFEKPVVATNVGGLSDTLDAGWSAAVTRPDPASIASAILHLAADPHLRHTLATNARLKAAACFTMDSWRKSQLPFFAAAGWLPPPGK